MKVIENDIEVCDEKIDRPREYVSSEDDEHAAHENTALADAYSKRTNLGGWLCAIQDQDQPNHVQARMIGLQEKLNTHFTEFHHHGSIARLDLIVVNNESYKMDSSAAKGNTSVSRLQRELVDAGIPVIQSLLVGHTSPHW